VTDPAKAGFEKCHFQFWKLAQYTATDDIETRSLHFPGMTHHVKEEGVFVAFLSEGRHLGAEAAVNGDRYIQLLCFAPEYIICRITQPSAIEWIGAHEHRAHAEIFDHTAHFFDRFIDILQRKGSDAEETVRVGLTEICYPVVICTTGSGGELGVVEVAVDEPQARIEEGDLDPFKIHVFGTDMRIIPATRNFVPTHRARFVWLG